MSLLMIAVPLIISFIAIVTDTTRKDAKFPARVTRAGWLLIALSCIVAAVNYLRGVEQSRRNEIRSFIAAKQLEKAVYTLALPYVVNSDPPEPKDRFQITSDKGYGSIFPVICDADLMGAVSSFIDSDIPSDIRWGRYATEKTRQGLNQLAQIQSSYGDVLDPDTNLQIGLVINHAWNEFLLSAAGRTDRRLPRAADPANANQATIAVPLCRNQKPMRDAYIRVEESHRHELNALETTAGLKICALRRHVGIEDDPPLFLRSIAGWIFIPNRFRTAGAPSDADTDSACHAIGAKGY